MATITTAVRALQLGDVLVDPLPTPVGGATSYVVLDLAVADPGPVGSLLAVGLAAYWAGAMLMWLVLRRAP